MAAFAEGFFSIATENSTSFYNSSGADTPFEWTFSNAGALFLAVMCALLANSAGVGGGPFYMPLFHSVLGFDMNSSTALSHTIVASSAVASSFYGILQRSPVDPGAPLIDFTLALTFVPALLVGTGIGVIFNTMVPNWFQTIGLVLLLSFVIYKTGKKAVHAWRSENRAKNQQIVTQSKKQHDEEEPHLPSVFDGEPSPLNQGLMHITQCKWSEASNDAIHEINSIREWLLVHGMADIKSHICSSWLPLLSLVALWVVFLGLKLGMSRSEKCTPPYFEFWGGQTLLCVVVTVGVVLKQVRQLEYREDTMDSGMRQLLLGQNNERTQAQGVGKLLQAVVIMVIAGATAGLLGIGGALIFNPFLLAMGVHPQVTASTAVLMILFSSSSISLSFYFQGMLNTSFATVFAPTCFVASLVGVTVVGNIVRRTGRASLIIIILVLLIIFGTLLTAILGSMQVFEDLRTWQNIGFKGFCE